MCFSLNALKMKTATMATNKANNEKGEYVLFLDTRTMEIHGVDNILPVAIIREINKPF